MNCCRNVVALSVVLGVAGCSGGGSGATTVLEPAVVTISASAVSFAGTNVASTAAAQSVTVSNSGQSAATLQAPTVSGDFAIVSDTCSSALAGGASCTLTVSFTPTASGPRTGTLTLVTSVSTLTLGLTGTGVAAAATIPNLQPYTDPTGTVATYTSASANDIVLSSNFFNTALGTNGRSCGSCHQLSQGMSVNAASLAALFASTNGTDPVFSAVDGANCPTSAAGNVVQHSLITQNGLFRITVALPTNAQFTMTLLNDPYGCNAPTTNAAGQKVYAVYRRPLTASSLQADSAVMWDTRETVNPLTTQSNFLSNLNVDLIQQATDAITGHAQATTAPTSAQLADIVAFEQTLYTAQLTDNLAGALNANGATGGPQNLFATVAAYYPGINDSLGNDPTGAKFNANSMTLFAAWANSANAQQASIARGERLFNTAPMIVDNVPGIPTPPAGAPPVSCSFCHDTPNVGSRSVPGAIDTGTAHYLITETNTNIVAAVGALSVPSLPMYQINGCKDANGNAVTYVTSDPGRALFTGQCADVSRTKVPNLRGLAARAPYFHGGSAASLAQVVAFYNARFQMKLTAAQQADLVNFLNAL